MALGIVLDYHSGLHPIVWITFFGSAAAAYFWSENIDTTSLRSHAYNATIICYLAMIVSFGGAWHATFDVRETPDHAKIINKYTWEELTINGTIQQIKPTSTGKLQVDVSVDTTIFPGNLQWHRPYTIRAVLDPNDHSVPDHLKLGNRITFSAMVYPLDEKSNPSQFDYKRYLASQNIYAQVGIQKIHNLQVNSSQLVSWVQLRREVLEAIENNFSQETSSLAKALLIGYKNELEREQKITFSRAGLSHIMAVSGLHVGFILAPFWIMIPLFWNLRYGKQIGLSLLIGILFVYAGLTNFSASVTRASLVGILLAYGKLFHKVRDSKNLTAVAALIILLFNPSDLFSIGFQLSFGAVYIILLTAPVIQRWLPNWIRFRWFGKPVMVVVISFIVQVGLFPLLAYYFGEFSIVGPLANAFVIPVLGIAVPYAIALLPVAIISPTIAHLLNTPVDLFLQWLHWFVNTTANWPWSWIQIHIESILFFCIWMVGIFLIASLRIPRLRWKILAVFLALLCAKQGNQVWQNLKPATLQLTYYDVGQGDATLVSTPRNSHFLIDAGRWQPDYNSAKYVIIPHLKEQGIEKLDAVFLSHPHADHIGGILELIKTIPIDTIYNSGTDYNSKLYQRYHKKAVEKDIPIIPLSAGDQIEIDPSIRLFIYGPAESNHTSNANNRSLILELIYGKTEFLFPGDSEQSQEQELIGRYPMLSDTDVLKVPHHGSKTSSTDALLQTLTPQMGVLSLGRQNQFEHPHQEATRRLHKHISQLYFTSLDGAIQLYSNGYDVSAEPASL